MRLKTGEINTSLTATINKPAPAKKNRMLVHLIKEKRRSEVICAKWKMD